MQRIALILTVIQGIIAGVAFLISLAFFLPSSRFWTGGAEIQAAVLSMATIPVLLVMGAVLCVYLYRKKHYDWVIGISAIILLLDLGFHF